jgi:hypothetical protein
MPLCRHRAIPAPYPAISSTEKGGRFIFCPGLLDRFIVLSLKDSASSGTWGNPSIPKTAAPVSTLISLFVSAVRCHISGIAAALLGHFGA